MTLKKVEREKTNKNRYSTAKRLQRAAAAEKHKIKFDCAPPRAKTFYLSIFFSFFCCLSSTYIGFFLVIITRWPGTGCHQMSMASFAGLSKEKQQRFLFDYLLSLLKYLPQLLLKKVSRRVKDYRERGKGRERWKVHTLTEVEGRW